MSALERPCVFIAPDVFSHHKKADAFFTVDAVVDAAEVVVHPAKDEFVVVDGGGGAEIAFAGVGFLLTAVRPRADDGARAGIFFAAAGGEETVEIGGGSIGAVGFVVEEIAP